MRLNWLKMLMVIRESVQILTMEPEGITIMAANMAVSSASDELGEEESSVALNAMERCIGSVSNQAIPILEEEIPLLVTELSV